MGNPTDAESRLTFRVRYYETDQMGYVHHANFVQYFEMGRTEWLRSRGDTYRNWEEHGVFLVVAKLACRYRRPACYDDELTLITRLTKVGVAKMDHTYELLRGSELIATGETTLACVDRDGRMQAIPQEFLDRTDTKIE
ncbi:Acyl-CoA thioester hydrolase YbgC [Planctomycetales bacterium 10988]|nr:Acyl-CoA thioester hydrolase YbgC [Planctomycetales bacterium 10988]